MTNTSSDKPLNMEQAKLDPAAVFGSPEKLLANTTLSKKQKIEFLRRWEYDAREISVATEEGMTGPSDDLLRRIMLALNELTGGNADLESSAPNKQRGHTQTSAKYKN